MNQRIVGTEASHRERWLALLDKYGVGHPKSLYVMEVPGGLVQATIGEPPGRMEQRAKKDGCHLMECADLAHRENLIWRKALLAELTEVESGQGDSVRSCKV